MVASRRRDATTVQETPTQSKPARSQLWAESTIDPKLQDWIVARKSHRLTHTQAQMARELGMNPKKLGKIDNHKAEPWKLPLPDFIESCYLKRFGRPPAEPIRSIEEISAAHRAKKKEKGEMKAAKRAAHALLDHLAFYGSLMRRAENHLDRVGVVDQLEYLGTCRIPGLGDYPGLVEGEGEVPGELWRIRDLGALVKLDAWELVDAVNPEKSVYLRRAKELIEPAGVEAWVYFYNSDVEGLPRIAAWGH